MLCIQDTCEVNLSNHKGRLSPNSGLGCSDKSDTTHCFKLHPGLVVDAKDFSPLGFSSIKVFHRPEDKPDKMKGYQFMRQKPIGNYIVDFLCNKLNLAIEVDGIVIILTKCMKTT